MKNKLLIVPLFIIILLILGFNPCLQTTTYHYTNPKIPSSFEGFRIVQISDLHVKNFGKNQKTLITSIKKCKPDIIVITGDLVDENHNDLTPVADLLKNLESLSPIYYVSGNHEFNPNAASQYKHMLALFEEYGVINMDDSRKFIYKDNDVICLTGSMWRSKWVGEYLPVADPNYFHILLYHGSDYFPLLSQFGYDLLLAGHVHGGIIRLPFFGGLLSNTGKLFPEYDSGIFTSGSFTMISSRGLGDSRIPRFNNRPELVCVVLHNT